MRKLTIEGKNFKLDGENFQIRSGAIHYFRVFPEYWEDRLIKLINCGFNTVETYVPWNIHEPEENKYCFEGFCDVERFVKTAQKVGLNVILRVTPYICAEWDLGGLPYWLLKYKDLHLRCYDKLFLEKVDKYYSVLLPKIKPLLSQNGGAIIAMSIENEYGSFGTDKQYLKALKDLYEKYDIDTFLFSCDGANEMMISCGMQDDVYEAVNFSCNFREKSFEPLEKLQPGKPRMCMECYPAETGHCKWGSEGYRPADVEKTISGFKGFFESGDSFNVFMFHGGTNFGFHNGSTNFGKLEPDSTKYWDANTFLNENGECTELYYKLKDAVKDIAPVDVIPLKEIPKKSYGNIKLTESAVLFENLDVLSDMQYSSYAKTFEELGLDYGFVLYRTKLPVPAKNMPITLKDLKGRLSFYIDGEFKGVKEPTGFRDDEITTPDGDCTELDILAENLGRINYGPYLHDEQGIKDGVLLGGQCTLFGYEMYPMSLKDISGIKYKKGFEKSDKPMFYRGCFNVDTPADTFLDMSQFSKGAVFVNGFNLGRYWNVGPFFDLYLPAPILKNGENEIVVFEIDGAAGDTVESKTVRTDK